MLSDSEREWSRAGQRHRQMPGYSPNAWWDRDETVENVIAAAVIH